MAKPKKTPRPKAETPKGFRDYFGGEVTHRAEMLSKIAAVYQLLPFQYPQCRTPHPHLLVLLVSCRTVSQTCHSNFPHHLSQTQLLEHLPEDPTIS